MTGLGGGFTGPHEVLVAVDDLARAQELLGAAEES
jgi:hypothetical protein